MKMRILQTAATVLVFLFTIQSSRADTKVEAEGKAPGNVANAREQALADALREAVRKGVGVDVLSSTSVRDFVLDYDRVFAASFGYVRNYSVLGSSLGEDGIYRVKVQAEVGEGQPARKDELALRQIIQLKGSPRVALEIDELIENVPVGSDYAKSWFEAAAKDMQMQLVDVKRANYQSDRLAMRDEVFGNSHSAEIRRAGISQNADFIIQAKVRGRHLGAKTIYGEQGNEFSIVVDLRAVVPETGDIVASVPMQGQELWSNKAAAETAARQLVQGMLGGIADKEQEFPGAWVLFRKVFAAWVAEVDLGELKRLELARISDTEYDRLQKALGQNTKVSAVFPREFDSKGFSFLDVETRLDPTGLKSEVLNALGGSWQYDHGTKAYLQFTRSGSGIGSSNDTTGTAGAPMQAAGSFPPWAWALVGAGVAAILFGVYSLGKKSKN